ncbi:MAG: hypothetical protein ABIQ74_09120, partial [Chitinophagales bacterium]
MRKTAVFPARDIQLFKKQLNIWAGNFFSALCLDPNEYTGFVKPYKLLAAAGEQDAIDCNQDVFNAIKLLFDKSPDWLFGYFSYDLKQETEKKLFSKPDFRFDGIQFSKGYFFRPDHIIEASGNSIAIHSFENPHDIFESISSITVIEFPGIKNKKVQQRISMPEYLKTIALLKSHITRGDIYEINFCQEFFIENILVDPPLLFNRLNEIS